MPYTLLFSSRAELRIGSSPDFLTALIRARKLVRAGATEVAILTPSGAVAFSHREIIQEDDYIAQLAERRCEPNLGKAAN